MKLRFAIDAAASASVRDALGAMAGRPPVGHRVSDVYLDTPDAELAAADVAMRFRRKLRLGVDTPGTGWRRQLIWPKGADGNLKALGIRRLKERLDATFSVRVERWTWRPNRWAVVSFDRIAVSTGACVEDTAELRIVCRRRRAEDAQRFAQTLGADHRVSRSARERGRAMLVGQGGR